MSNQENASSPAARLAEARLKRWHQNGEALLTFENMRSWINAAGLVLFAPRPQVAAPAPSMLEAMLGAPSPNPSLQQISDARGLLARLVGEGLAVPLNLLGSPTGIGTDTPDFIASSAVFPYLFTLRGDKAWKQPPAISGPTKVSNLAFAAYQLIAQRHAMTAAELTTELGKEVTESAVLRALTELWTHFRVLPLPQADGATLWELASARYTKQIKAGANAGLPTALSALISLYLGQALIATEDDIETFLSPVAPRSRIRDVIHALLAARQLDTYTLEGRSFLHIAGEAPGFLSDTHEPPLVETQAEPAESIAIAESEAGEGVDGSARIKKFVPKPRKIGTGYLAKAKPAKFSPRPPARPGFGRRDDRTERPPRPERSDRERRPFLREGGYQRGERPQVRREPGAPPPRQERFSRPQDDRPFAPRRDRSGEFERRPRRPDAGQQRPNKQRFSERPRDEARTPPERPVYRKFDAPRGPRPSRPFTSERPSRTEEPGRPPRPFDRAAGAGWPGRRPPAGQPNRAAGKPDRREGRPGDQRREGGPDRRREPGPTGRRAEGGFSGKKPFGQQGRGERPKFADKPSGKFAGRPSGKFASKPSGKFAGRPSGNFAGKKPSGKPGPRKSRPRDESA